MCVVMRSGTLGRWFMKGSGATGDGMGGGKRSDESSRRITRLAGCVGLVFGSAGEERTRRQHMKITAAGWWW